MGHHRDRHSPRPDRPGPGVSFSRTGLVYFGLVIGACWSSAAWRTVDDALRLGPVVARCSFRYVPVLAPPASTVPVGQRCAASLPRSASGCSGSPASAPSRTSSSWRPGRRCSSRSGRSTTPRAAATRHCRASRPRWDGRQRVGHDRLARRGYGSRRSSWPGSRARRIDADHGRGHQSALDRGARRCAVRGRLLLLVDLSAVYTLWAHGPREELGRRSV